MVYKRFAALGAVCLLAGCALGFGTAAPQEDVPVAKGVAADEVTAPAAPDIFSALFAAPGPAADTGPTHRFGDPVPYGELARVCDAPARPGTRLAQAGGFAIYDSAPDSTTLRAHYITGFDDGCARQFSAALVLTGDVGTHEIHRYLPSTKAAFNATDQAYEQLKARYCGVAQRQPCGRRLDALARSTTFITAYETFGSQPRWVEILVHDGEALGIDFKTR